MLMVLPSAEGRVAPTRGAPLGHVQGKEHVTQRHPTRNAKQQGRNMPPVGGWLPKALWL